MPRILKISFIFFLFSGCYSATGDEEDNEDSISDNPGFIDADLVLINYEYPVYDSVQQSLYISINTPLTVEEGGLFLIYTYEGSSYHHIWSLTGPQFRLFIPCDTEAYVRIATGIVEDRAWTINQLSTTYYLKPYQCEDQ